MRAEVVRELDGLSTYTEIALLHAYMHDDEGLEQSVRKAIERLRSAAGIARRLSAEARSAEITSQAVVEYRAGRGQGPKR